MAYAVKAEVMDTSDVRPHNNLVERVDKYVNLLTEDLLGLSISRADAIRHLSMVKLRDEEKRLDM